MEEDVSQRGRTVRENGRSGEIMYSKDDAAADNWGNSQPGRRQPEQENRQCSCRQAELFKNRE
jgi:hypothetical protein